VKSIARDRVVTHNNVPPTLTTGFAAYRATVNVEKMREDPDTAWLLESPSLHLWLGDMRHVMSYTIAGGKSFNMVLSHPDSSDPTTWNQETALSDMQEHFKGWDSRLTKLIRMITSTMKWPLISGRALDRWVAPSNRLLILGDAAHAMVPYMSQGAAMAVEDAAALAEALDHAADSSDIPAVLRVWESVRITRSSQMQEASLINGKLWHYRDGREQKARDEAMRPEIEGRPCVSSPNQWSDPVCQRWCYGYDAERAIKDAFAQIQRQGRAWSKL
jgi:salicylate hydroxylase